MLGRRIPKIAVRGTYEEHNRKREARKLETGSQVFGEDQARGWVAKILSLDAKDSSDHL